jgi:voltage-gated potassium channel
LTAGAAHGARLKRPSLVRRVWRRAEVALGGPALLIALLTVVGLFVVASVLMFAFERYHNPAGAGILAAFGWVGSTLVFGEPWHGTSAGGQTARLMILLLKPGSIALLTAAVTTKFFQLLSRKGAGMGRTKVKDHIVICGWSGKGEEIIQEIRGRDDEERNRPVVILAPLAANPSRDPLTTFISGDPTQAHDLERAGIPNARTAIVLADNSYPDIDAEDMDSRTLLATLAVESMNASCYTCVEVIHSKNREHFKRTRADELVVSAKLTGALLANSAVAHGLSRIVGDLLTFPKGSEFYWMVVPASLDGVRFTDALQILKQRLDAIPVAVDEDGTYLTNPPADHRLRASTRLLVISGGDPNARDCTAALAGPFPSSVERHPSEDQVPTAPPEPQAVGERAAVAEPAVSDSGALTGPGPG